MSGFNPFRPRNPEGEAASRISTTHNPSKVTPVAPSLPGQPTPNDVPGKSSISLEIDVDDSTTSDEQPATDPFHSESSQSDNDDAEGDDEALRIAAPPLHIDRPRDSFGSAPPAPSDGSTPSSVSTTEPSRTSTRSKGPTSPVNDVDVRNLARARNKQNKPPPPPRSHHGKRISHTATADPSSSQAAPSRSTNRLSFHPSSPESLTSPQAPGSSYPSTSSHPLATDYFTTLSESQSESTDSLRRSHSQTKRPPIPPISRRHSQIRRSKSTQSKSSTNPLTMSSGDSDSNSSLPPSPGSLSFTSSSLSQDRKRISMPPPASSSGDLSALAPSTRTTERSSSPANSRPTPLQAGRRASSQASLLAGSSSMAPPPPPPRRGRDSNTRSSEPAAAEETPLPQPSNAQDILANLSQLQKEVDDLRGHYESRKVSS